MDDLDQQLAHLQLMNARDLSPKAPLLHGIGGGGPPSGLVKKVGPAVPRKPIKKPQQQQPTSTSPTNNIPLPPTSQQPATTQHPTPPPPPTTAMSQVFCCLIYFAFAWFDYLCALILYFIYILIAFVCVWFLVRACGCWLEWFSIVAFNLITEFPPILAYIIWIQLQPLVWRISIWFKWNSSCDILYISHMRARFCENIYNNNHVIN